MSIPATVAYPEQMEEDKSAGMYIKTENWHGDDELDNRHGYRKGRDGDIHNKRRDNYKKGDYKKNDYKKGPSRASGTPRHSDYKKNNRKPYIDPAKLAGLSYEERMKLYKDAYSKGGYKKNDYKKPYNKKGPSTGSGTARRYDNRQQQKPAPKKTFWQKVKSFFGR